MSQPGRQRPTLGETIGKEDRRVSEAPGSSRCGESVAADGEAQRFEKLLTEYETDLDLTAQMCATLAKLGLFSPFQFQVIESESPGPKIEGMHRIDEAKLAALKPLSLKALATRWLMSRIYAHIHSLENFARLYQRAVARQAMA